METVSPSVITDWLAAVRAKLDLLAGPLRDRFREVNVQVGAGLVGGLTEFDGQHVYLEAVLPGGDSIALEITTAYVSTKPRVSAAVCWDAEAGGVAEAQTFERWESSTEWPVASATNLVCIDQDLPRLLKALSSAIDRRTRSSLM